MLNARECLECNQSHSECNVKKAKTTISSNYCIRLSYDMGVKTIVQIQ